MAAVPDVGLLEQLLGRDGHGVEVAEAHRLFKLSMVAGWSNQSEAVSEFAVRDLESKNDFYHPYSFNILKTSTRWLDGRSPTFNNHQFDSRPSQKNIQVLQF